jgi:putative FmdB family regulatory protein
VPIYEYVCMKCESHFEELVRGEEQITCPDCAATTVARQFSSFAVHGVAKAPSLGGRAVGGGGGCCGGSCGCGH